MFVYESHLHYCMIARATETEEPYMTHLRCYFELAVFVIVSWVSVFLVVAVLTCVFVYCSCKSVVLPVEEGENGPVTPDSPELNTQDTRVNGGSSVQLKDGKAAGAGAGTGTASQNNLNHSGSLRRVSIYHRILNTHSPQLIPNQNSKVDFPQTGWVRLIRIQLI